MVTRTEDSAMHRLPATALFLAALTISRGVSAATPDELEARVDALAAQVVALQSEVAALKAEKAVATAGAPLAMAPAASAAPEPQVQWFGYGELNYSRPTGDASAATADVARFVLGASYAFDDR